MTDDERAALREYLDDDWQRPDRISCLIALLRDARLATGRDLTTGELLDAPPCGTASCWIGACAYLIVIDQLGTCFIGGGKVEDRFCGAIGALGSVTDERQIQALYALRCAFAHDYGLFNPSGRQELRHKFRLHAAAAEPLVTVPNPGWDGTYSEVPRERETRVNLVRLGDEVEGMVRRVRQAFDGDTLSLKVEPQELLLRFRLRKLPA